MEESATANVEQASAAEPSVSVDVDEEGAHASEPERPRRVSDKSFSGKSGDDQKQKQNQNQAETGAQAQAAGDDALSHSQPPLPAPVEADQADVYARAGFALGNGLAPLVTGLSRAPFPAAADLEAAGSMTMSMYTGDDASIADTLDDALNGR